MKYQWDPTIICGQDPTATPERVNQYRTYYRVKYDIVQMVNPKTIVEIGVRAGYSAWAFLTACPDAKYEGFDADNGTHGGQGGPWTWWAKKILSERGFNFKIHTPVNTQNMDKMPISADFYHVDGDHTEKGVIHDLNICFEAALPGASILVDDYEYIETVRNGVDKWIAKNPGISYEIIPSLRGEVLITKS